MGLFVEFFKRYGLINEHDRDIFTDRVTIFPVFPDQAGIEGLLDKLPTPVLDGSVLYFPIDRIDCRALHERDILFCFGAT